jgi:hypothetical protein
MIALVFEVYGAFCFLSLLAFLVWAAEAKLRPDLDEEEFDLAELEKLVSTERSGDALSLEPPIMEESSWSPPPSRPVKRSKRLIQRRPHLIHLRSGGNRP